MKKINKLVKQIDEEICSAKHYAEEFIEFRINEDGEMMSKYKQMATDELNHAMILHERAVAEIEKLRKVYPVPEDMQEIWNKSHSNYLEKVSMIKQMLQM